VEDEKEDVLEIGRPPLPRWVRLGALILAVLAALALFAVRVWPGSRTTHPVAVPPSTPTAPASEVSPEPSRATPTATPWPTAQGACGSDVDLSIVSSTPRRERTGIRVLLGGDRLRVVDFDSGDAVALTDTGLRPGEYADVLAGPTSKLATTQMCESGRSKVLRVGADRRVSVVGSLGQTEGVLVGGDRAWVVSYPTDVDHPYGSVTPLGGGHRVRLAAGFYPYAAAGDTLVGVSQPDPLSVRGLLLVDATTGRTLTNLGQTALLVAAGRGQVIWTGPCDPGSDRRRDLQRRQLSTGSTTSYRLPRPASCGGPGVVSADGKLVAFTLERARAYPLYEGHPMPPSDLAVLHLDTGRLEIVPGIELPAKVSPGLAFSADGRWLAIALDAGTRIRLLAWRSGLRHPYETNAIPGQVRAPTLVMLSPPTQR
jgi:hypothetical protein